MKSEVPIQEIIPREKNKKIKKLETGINTCFSLIKQHWNWMTKIPQERDFPTWSIQNFVKK